MSSERYNRNRASHRCNLPVDIARDTAFMFAGSPQQSRGLPLLPLSLERSLMWRAPFFFPRRKNTLDELFLVYPDPPPTLGKTLHASALTDNKRPPPCSRTARASARTKTTAARLR